MTEEKFVSEVETLKKFIETYCHNKHKKLDISLQNRVLKYKSLSYDFQTNLCSKCEEVINYSIERLNECPYEEKHRCRTCPNSCYEKKQWQTVAKIMIYSGINLGISKLKKRFKF